MVAVFLNASFNWWMVGIFVVFSLCVYNSVGSLKERPHVVSAVFHGHKVSAKASDSFANQRIKIRKKVFRSFRSFLAETALVIDF